MTEGKETSISAIDAERAEAKFVKEESTSGNAGYKTSEKQNNESEKQEVEKNVVLEIKGNETKLNKE